MVRGQLGKISGEKASCQEQDSTELGEGWQTADPAHLRTAIAQLWGCSRRPVLGTPAMQQAGPVPPDLSVFRVNFCTVVFMSRVYIDRYTNPDF